MITGKDIVAVRASEAFVSAAGVSRDDSFGNLAHQAVSICLGRSFVYGRPGS